MGYKRWEYWRIASVVIVSLLLPELAHGMVDSNHDGSVLYQRDQTSRQNQYIVLSPLTPHFQISEIVGGEQINTITGMLIREWCHVITLRSEDKGFYWQVHGDDVLSKAFEQPNSPGEQVLVCTFADEAFYQLQLSAHPVASYQIKIRLFEKCEAGAVCE